MTTKDIHILLCGDLCLYNIDSSRFSIDKQWQQLVSNCDLVCANLENPITQSAEKKPHQVINLSSDQTSISMLKRIGVQVVSLANNHIQDFLQQGIDDTKISLSKSDIMYFGIGNSLKDACNPFIAEIAGLKIAIFGATRYANITKEMEGTAPDDSRYLYKNIKRYKKDNYFVIVYYHWGYEYVRIPSPRERNLAHKAIDYGADLVVGAHPHIYQGIETYKDKTIVYSLGNFLFHSSVYSLLSPLPTQEELVNSFCVEIVLNHSYEYRVNIHGYEISDTSFRLYADEENVALQSDLTEISQKIVRSRVSYLLDYYRQATQISHQNIQMRNKFQKVAVLSLKDKIQLYANANIQDLNNRLVAILFKLLNCL